VRIQLSGKRGLGTYVLVDAEWAPFLGAFPWNLDSDGYAKTTMWAGTAKAAEWAMNPVLSRFFYRASVKLHRLLMLLNGHDPSKQVDHINGVRLDCRLANLRPADQSQSSRNSRKRTGGTSHYHGVYRPQDGGWQVRITSGGRQKKLDERPFAKLNEVLDDGRTIRPRTRSEAAALVRSRMSPEQRSASARKSAATLRARRSGEI